MNELWQRLTTWLRINAPQLLLTLQPGATQQAIVDLERRLGVRLPDDYRAFLALCDGQRIGAAFRFYNAEELLCTTKILTHWQHWNGLLEAGAFESYQSEPDAGIRTDWWNAKWIPFTHDLGGHSSCLDLNPAKGGTVGQVITMWRDSEERELMYGSFTAWLTHVVAGLESGKIVFSENEYAALIDASELE